jgi:hypothetical protein
MKTDLKVELFLIHQTYFTDNHGNTCGHPQSWMNRIWQNKPYEIGSDVQATPLYFGKKSAFPRAPLTEIFYGTD